MGQFHSQAGRTSFQRPQNWKAKRWLSSVPTMVFHEVPLLLLKLATVIFYGLHCLNGGVPRKPTLLCAKGRHWHHLSLPEIHSLKKNYSNALRNGGGISDIITGRGDVWGPGTPSGIAV